MARQFVPGRQDDGISGNLARAQSTASVDSLFLPKTPATTQYQGDSRTATMLSQNYAFNPNMQTDYMGQPGGVYEEPGGGHTRQSTMLDSQQGYFSDFAGQQNEDYRESYGGGFHRYSQSEAFSPTANMAPPPIPSSELPHGAVIDHLLPLEPRDVPFAVHDPHDPNTPMSKFDNIPTVLQIGRAHV